MMCPALFFFDVYAAPRDLHVLTHSSPPPRSSELMSARPGKEQGKIWRRSFDVPPPPVEPGSQYDPSMDRRYAGVDVPRTESLKDTIARVLPYWNKAIAPALKGGERVLISAHGNSLREIGRAHV